MNGLLMMTAKKPRPNVNPILVDFKCVCQLVGFSENKIRDLIALGRFPKPQKVEGGVRFFYPEIMAWAEKYFGDQQ